MLLKPPSLPSSLIPPVGYGDTCTRPKMFPSLHSDGVQRQICIGDTYRHLRPWFTTKFLFACGLFFSVYSWLAVFPKAIHKRRHHLTTFSLENLHFDHRTTLAYQRLFGKNIRKGRLPLLSSARSFLAWLWLALERSQRYACAFSFGKKRKAVD
jgi:hypothetical protein